MKNSILILTIGLFLCSTGCQKESIDLQSGHNAGKLPEELQVLENIFDGEGVGAAFNLTQYPFGDVVILFNLEGTKYAWLENNMVLGVRELKGENSHFRGLPLESVGAVGFLHIEKVIYFFNKKGDKYTILPLPKRSAYGAFYNPDYFEFSQKTFTIEDFGRFGNCPYVGITAFVNIRSGTPEPKWEVYLVDASGKYMVRYEYSEKFGTESVPADLRIYNWSDFKQSTYLEMETIGAMTIINEMLVFFTSDGTQFKTGREGRGRISQLYDLY